MTPPEASKVRPLPIGHRAVSRSPQQGKQQHSAGSSRYREPHQDEAAQLIPVVDVVADQVLRLIGCHVRLLPVIEGNASRGQASISGIAASTGQRGHDP